MGDLYRAAIEKRLYEPFSDLWAYCVAELQGVERRLDILCAADIKTYPRLKPYHRDLPSNRYQWLLDCLAMLAEGEAFAATENEIKELKAQRDFELTKRPGAERRRKIEWLTRGC